MEATPADTLMLYPHVLLACFALLALPSVTVSELTLEVLATVCWTLPQLLPRPLALQPEQRLSSRGFAHARPSHLHPES